MKKNKGLIITIVVIVLVALWGISSYNGLDGIDENLSKKYALLLSLRSKVNTLIEPLRKENQIHSSSEAKVLYAPESEEEKKLIEELSAPFPMGMKIFVLKKMITIFSLPQCRNLQKTIPATKFIKKHEYTIEEKLINLCDLMCPQGNKVFTIDKRLIDIMIRRGAYSNTQYHIKETYKLKEYFDNLLGYNLYDLFPEIKENL